MRNTVTILFCAIAALTATAKASTPDFDVTKDRWYGGLSDALYVNESWSDVIDLDFTSDPDWYHGITVNTATLELDFTNDFTDNYKVWVTWLGKEVWFWDNREFIRVRLEDGSLLGFGEVDNGQYEQQILFTDVLDDGVLSFRLRAANRTGTGDAWLDHARLYGNFTDLPPTNPVPEPLTLSAVALSAAGLGGYLRRRRRRG